MSNAEMMCDRVLAIAGVVQSAFLVQELARYGTIREGSALQSCIESLFVTNPETTREVYGGVAGVAIGLRLVRRHLGGTPESPSTSEDRERVRYFFSLLQLERRIRRLPHMLDHIGEGIELAHQQVRAFGVATHPTVIASLAELYLATVSTLGFRIQVQGNKTHLTHPQNVDLVRALLLAGVRSAVLLRQRGGRRWMLLLQRPALLEAAGQLLTSLTH